MTNFTRRVSEGRKLDDLWKQFAADASAGYGFYGRDVGWEEIRNVPGWRRPFRAMNQLFWAVFSKMSPARRVVLLITLALAFLGASFVLPIILLVLLFLELADKVTMKRDLEIAREIQSWLVPAHPPEVPGAEIAFATRPQNSVAGDYYDAFYMDAADPAGAGGSKLMIVIADVAGKSIPAALLMATLQASLRTIAGEGAPLVDLLARLNRYACAHSHNGQRFTTAVLSEYDPHTRVLSYVNAGHNAPILRRAGGQLEKLEVGGLPLGIHFPVTYETASIELQPGDALIFYTDGVIEAFNKELQEFGDERWCRTISALPSLNAQESLQFLMKPVDEFVGSTRQSDDITYLVFRCN
ncbi:MAG: serine/threonine-protein phosphatase [Acidobacteriota bacterium]|nr:serine/threonine-protein phosphatase [Acidobacteriota bacterium]